MKKNSIIFIACSLVAAGALSACSPTGSSSVISGGLVDKTPDLTIDVSNHNDICIKGIYPAFGHSDDKVKNGYLAGAIKELTTYDCSYRQLSESADTEINKILTMKEDVDMLKCYSTTFNNYVIDGYFTDLTDVIAKYGQKTVDDKGTKFVDLFTKEQWDSCTYNGRIYAIPETGHTSMFFSALVWNRDHLNAVGITKIPENLTEFDTAVHALQNHFGGDNNKNYHAFGLSGNISVNNTLSPAFGVPMRWYEDAEGNLQNELFSTQMENYLRYMNGLKREKIIVADWSGTSESTAMNNFTKEYCSVYDGSYWNIKALRKMLVASYKSFPDEVISTTAKTNYVRGETFSVPVKDDGLVSWRAGLKGDGSFNSEVQSASKNRESRSVGAFITVPATNCKRAAYVVDWLVAKNSAACTALVAGGKEGRHWVSCNASDEGAIKLLTETPKYVKKLDAYDEEISGMEQYQTGLNCEEGRKWWPLAERGFDAWNVLLVDENGQEQTDRIIFNKFAYHPILENFAKYDLNAQNHVVTVAQSIINSTDDATFTQRLTKSRDQYKTKYYDKFSEEINTWYKAQKEAN